ncbi:MAG: hypothetical protein RI988_1374 [Pseudomonadota bacterium]
MKAAGAAAWGRCHAWALLAALLDLGALGGQFAGAFVGETAAREALGWVPGHALTEPWRAWTAAWVHLNGAHLTGNLLACVAVGAFGQFAAWAVRAAPGTGGTGRDGGTFEPLTDDAITPAWTLAWLAAWPLTHLLLAAEPRVTGYAGLSGVLHAGVAVATLGLLVQGRGRARAVGAAVLAGLVVKLALEQAWRAPVQALQDGDMPVAVAAHAAGACAGLACGAAALLVRRATMRSGRLRGGRFDPGPP